MKCNKCFYLSTASSRKFCYFHLKEVAEGCQDFLQKECKICDYKVKNKCKLENKNYPKVCKDFRRFKNWAQSLNK